MGTRSLLLRFIADERGTESVEFGIVGLVVACGSVQGFRAAQAVLKDKLDTVADELGSIE